MNDRLDKYLVKNMDDYAFMELMPEYIRRQKLDFMRNIPLPIRKEAVGELAGPKGIPFQHFIMGMVNVIGMKPSFRYVPNYITFLKYMNANISEVIVKVALKQAQNGMLTDACISLRAALVIREDDPDALYNYMLVCRNLYSESDDKEFVTDFKTEVNETLLRLREVAPDLDMTYYYLGFAFLNEGRYADAQREWKHFLEIARPTRENWEIREIRRRLEELETPVRIEQGYQAVMRGDFETGLAVLEEYRETAYMDNWWPLSYYLGVGYNRTGQYDEAVQMLRHALGYNPSGGEILAELVIAHQGLGDELNAEKYRRKIEVIRKSDEERFSKE